MVKAGIRRGLCEGTVWFYASVVSDFDRTAFGDTLAQSLSSKSSLYKEWKGQTPDIKGYWEIAKDSSSTDFAERIVPTGTEKQSLEAASRRVRGSRQSFSTERWLWSEEYEYDANGNRTALTNGWGTIASTYDDENYILIAGNKTYTWDANGNMIMESLGSVSAVYEYNQENRVVDVNTEVAGLVGRWQKGGDWSLTSGVRYDYDALGRRVTRAEYETVESGRSWGRSWDDETVTDYLYDGTSMNALAEFRDTAYSPDYGNAWMPWLSGMGSRSKWGSTRSWQNSRGWGQVSSGKYRPMSEYVYGNDLVSRTDWDPERSNLTWEDTEYYHQDILGSTMLLSARKGSERERYRYDNFGNVYEGTFERLNEFGFTGKRYDSSTGKYDYGYRDYDPVVSRFTTMDPIRDGNNWFAYVNNDPVNFIDPFGLEDCRLSARIENLRKEASEIFVETRIGVIFGLFEVSNPFFTVSLTADLASVGGNFYKSNLQSSLFLDVDIAKMDYWTLGYYREVEQRGGQTAFDLLSSDAKTEKVDTYSTDTTISWGISGFSTTFSITETADLFEKAGTLIIDLWNGDVK